MVCNCRWFAGSATGGLQCMPPVESDGLLLCMRSRGHRARPAKMARTANLALPDTQAWAALSYPIPCEASLRIDRPRAESGVHRQCSAVLQAPKVSRARQARQAKTELPDPPAVQARADWHFSAAMPCYMPARLHFSALCQSMPRHSFRCTGLKGDPGSPGAQGVPGLAGKDGVPGINGAAGDTPRASHPPRPCTHSCTMRRRLGWQD